MFFSVHFHLKFSKKIDDDDDEMFFVYFVLFRRITVDTLSSYISCVGWVSITLN